MNDALPRRGQLKLLRSVNPQRSRTLYLVAVSLLATLIPLIFFAGFWIRSELSKTQRDLEALLNGQAKALSERVDGTIEQQLHALQVVAALPALDEDLGTFRNEAARVVRTIPNWVAVAVIDPSSGEQIANTLRAIGDRSPRRIDKTVLDQIGKDRKPLVRSVDAGNGPIFDGRGIILYLPVIGERGLQSILALVLKSEDLQALVTQQTYDSRSLTVIVDERQTLIARSRAPEEYVGRSSSAEFQALVGGRATGIFDSRTLDGQEVATSFVRSPLTGWLAVASMDRRQFDSASRRSVWATIVAGALSITLAGILAVFLFHNVMEQRVSNERLSASRALGDLDARLLATTQDALGEQRKAASEREVLLREIYHRVKNNLQIVQSLLRLGSRELTPEQREPFENAVRRIGAMARVHTLLYNSPDLASIDFRDYLQELTREACDAFGADERGIAVTLEAKSMRVPLDTAVPLAFIAVEILTNAFRHAFPAGHEGTIRLESFREGDRGHLVISDNGIGVPEKVGGRRSLGLTIAAKLVQQIGGTLDEPRPGSSTFRIEFPLPAEAPAAFDAPTPRS